MNTATAEVILPASHKKWIKKLKFSMISIHKKHLI